jgi:hypothetical protein
MAEQKPKSTVRARKLSKSATTQRFLPISEIRNDTVLLKNGGLRAVLAVEALNFNLKSETEQQGIIAGYGAFLNTVTFPLQIVIRSTRTNIDDYLANLRTIAGTQPNELLKNQTLGYVAFMQRLLEVADIMQKRFYLVIPVDRSIRRKTGLEKFFEWLSPDDTSAKASARNRDFTQGLRELKERVELVQTGLSNIGLHCKRMPTRDLLELYYQIFNPKTSQIQKIPQDLETLRMEKTVL